MSRPSRLLRHRYSRNLLGTGTLLFVICFVVYAKMLFGPPPASNALERLEGELVVAERCYTHIRTTEGIVRLSHRCWCPDRTPLHQTPEGAKVIALTSRNEKRSYEAWDLRIDDIKAVSLDRWHRDYRSDLTWWGLAALVLLPFAGLQAWLFYREEFGPRGLRTLRVHYKTLLDQDSNIAERRRALFAIADSGDESALVAIMESAKRNTESETFLRELGAVIGKLRGTSEPDEEESEAFASIQPAAKEAALEYERSTDAQSERPGRASGRGQP
jgi:hypothetical protein